MDIFEKLADQLRGQDKTIVFPEGEDPRVLGAAIRLKKDQLVEPVVTKRPLKRSLGKMGST